MKKETETLKFHDAIQKAKGKQIKNAYFSIEVTGNQVEFCSCATGGALLVAVDYKIGSISFDDEKDTLELEERFPIVKEEQYRKYPCPVCGVEAEGLIALISCLNDNHDLSRLEIADLIQPIEEAWERTIGAFADRDRTGKETMQLDRPDEN